MRLPALRHLVESVQALARCENIRVLGSSSLLASFPQLGETGGPLEVSFDADLLIEPCDESLAAMLHEAVGEGSLFAQRTGYFADLLRPQIADTLAPGWQSRLVPLSEVANATALAPEDLLVVKLRTGRPKDLELTRYVLHSRLVNLETLRARLAATPLEEREMTAVYRRLREVTNQS